MASGNEGVECGGRRCLGETLGAPHYVVAPTTVGIMSSLKAPVDTTLTKEVLPAC